MPGRWTRDLKNERTCIVEQQSRVSLAIVDVESYPTFLSRKADHLDLLQHLCEQTEALTAAIWEVPDLRMQLKLVLADDHRAGEELTRSGHYVIATGRVRTFGRLCLVSQERLLDLARHPGQDLLTRCRAAVPRSPHVLLVPSGVYEVTIFSGSVPVRRGGPASEAGALDYVVVLRHFPHPAPRLHPIRLRSVISELARKVEATPAHKFVVPVNSIASFHHLQEFP